MSIVALKRKINAKKNISNRQINSFKVYDSSPGVNSKRGLVARTGGTVVNRNNRVEARSYHAHMSNPTSIKTVENVNVKQTVGFSINGTKNIRGTVERDSNLAYQFEKPGCCSDDGTTIKRSVTSTKGMLYTKKYRNNKCCQKSEKDKLCEKKSLKDIEKQTTSASDVIADRKHKNEICANVNPLCIVSSDSPSQKCCQCTDEEKAQRPSWCRKAANSVHINHGNGTAQSSSDYILQKKARNQHKISNTNKSLFSDLDCDGITSSDSSSGGSDSSSGGSDSSSGGIIIDGGSSGSFTTV